MHGGNLKLLDILKMIREPDQTALRKLSSNLREKENLSNKQIADYAGVDRTTVSKWIKKARNVK